MEYELLLLINTLGVVVIGLILVYHCFGKFTHFNDQKSVFSRKSGFLKFLSQMLTILVGLKPELHVSGENEQIEN